METGVLLQYMDDLLIAAETEKESNEWTVTLLNFLGLNRYKVSQQKSQITRKQVIYKISGGQ